MDIKKNIPLIISLSIPALMIIFVGLGIYLPGLFVRPKTDFVYASGGDYYSVRKYTLKGNKIIEVEVNYPQNYRHTSADEVKLFIHDVTKNKSKEISFAEVQKFTLDRNHKSPDGFEIVSGTSGGSMFYYRSGYYREKYIKGRGFSKRLNIRTPPASGDYYSYGNRFNFICWVIG